MTLSQAKARYPHVPSEIVKWAIKNIPDPRDIERGLERLESAKRVELKYAR
jgi:hypothetical protein